MLMRLVYIVSYLGYRCYEYVYFMDEGIKVREVELFVLGCIVCVVKLFFWVRLEFIWGGVSWFFFILIFGKVGWFYFFVSRVCFGFGIGSVFSSRGMF